VDGDAVVSLIIPLKYSKSPMMVQEILIVGPLNTLCVIAPGRAGPKKYIITSHYSFTLTIRFFLLKCFVNICP
jgi:hypothetical protein